MNTNKEKIASLGLLLLRIAFGCFSLEHWLWSKKKSAEWAETEK